MKTYATKIRPGSNPDSKPCTNEISICSMHGQNGLEIQYDLFQMRFKSFHEMLPQCNLKGFLKNAIKKRGKPVQPPLFFAVVPGFEPGQTEPKPVVLPLHHTTISLMLSKGKATLYSRAKIEKTILL